MYRLPSRFHSPIITTVALCAVLLAGCGKEHSKEHNSSAISSSATGPTTSPVTAPAISFAEMKDATGEKLARIVAGVLEKKPPDVNKIRVWQTMLDSKDLLVTNGELADAHIQVRDFALLLIEAAIGDGMQHCGPTRSVQIKKKISCPSEEHGRYRFDFCVYTDEDFAKAKQHIDFWLSGYDEGTGQKSEFRDHPAE